MKWSYHIGGEPPIVTLVASGPAEFGGFAEYLDSILSDPTWHRGMKCLADFRQLNLNTLTHADVIRLADLHIQFAERIGDSRIACVVSRPVDFGIFRMWQAMVAEKFPAQAVFYDLVEAMRWLEKDMPENPDAVRPAIAP